jgi:hypothetical protein
MKHGKATILLCSCHVWKGREGSERLEMCRSGAWPTTGGLGDGVMRLGDGATGHYRDSGADRGNDC